MHGFWAGKRRNSSPYRKWNEVHRPQQGVRGLRSPELSIQGNKKNIIAALILRDITRFLKIKLAIDVKNVGVFIDLMSVILNR